MKGQISSDEFLRWLGEYAGHSPAIHESAATGRVGSQVPVESLREHRFYFFDADACHAVAHAIEVLALEHASGKVTSLLGDFSDFETHRECYCQLAATLEKVIVLGHGRAPKVKGLQIRQEPATRQFHGIVFASNDSHAAFLCRSSPKNPQFWHGFFSVTPRVVKRLESQVNLLKGSALEEFERLESIDRAAAELDRELHRQRTILDEALQKLQADPQYTIRQFGAEVDKGLATLSGWKSRLSV